MDVYACQSARVKPNIRPPADPRCHTNTANTAISRDTAACERRFLDLKIEFARNRQ